MEGVSAEAERLLLRLFMKADDYGRFHAHPRLVRSACFPLADDLRANTVAAWLTELSDRQLVFCYQDSTGKPYLAIVHYAQRLRNSTPKFPAPDGKPDRWTPIPMPEPAEDGDGAMRQLAATRRKPRQLAAVDVDGDGDGDGDGDVCGTPRTHAPEGCTGVDWEVCRGWTAAEYAADFRQVRPEYGGTPDAAILQALQAEADPEWRARAYCDWKAADLGSIEADKHPQKSLRVYLRNARKFGGRGSSAGGTCDPATDTREVV